VVKLERGSWNGNFRSYVEITCFGVASAFESSRPALATLTLLTAQMAPGERSEEVHLWYTAVYEAVQEIPRGRVTSYGHIARLLGKRERSFEAHAQP
jgi:O6-methylguanine-DNA--protein-cysteine methyltransferase